jgi:non-ribosomal peptide synthetase component F
LKDNLSLINSLRSRANQLAHYLQGQGVGPEMLVPICLERSLEMIIGIIGILKAGAAYVPLDPSYPRERLQYMLEDSAASVVVTSEANQHLLAGSGKRHMVVMDSGEMKISEQSTARPAVYLQPTNLAYVIYTSGSTGRPKGVLNEHRGVVNRLLWAQDYHRLTTQDTILQKTTFCFRRVCLGTVLAVVSRFQAGVC